jgi:hypothetical protein
MAISQFNFPTTIRFGAGVVNEITRLFKKEQHRPSPAGYRP